MLNPDFVCYYPNAEGGEDYWLQRTFSLPGQGGRKMPMRERLRKAKLSRSAEHCKPHAGQRRY